jgi:hypothetical protein
MTTDNTPTPRRPLSKRHAKRLLNVARALRESRAPQNFTMCKFGDSLCGTPACALGHYAVRKDLQKAFALIYDGYSGAALRSRQYINGPDIGYNNAIVCKHFGIDWNEAAALFSMHGCDYAHTPIAAAEYIERFVRERTRAGREEQPT